MSQHVIRDVVVGRLNGNDQQWTLSVRLGGPTTRLIPVRSRREPLRFWSSLKAVAKYVDGLGLRGFVVAL
ncbi:hypothetical protein D9M71_771590 [compost metagenome]